MDATPAGAPGPPSDENPKPPYEPPRLTPLGDLRDLLAFKSGAKNDPSQPISHTFKK